MNFRIDMHVHSSFSGDNDSDPEESVQRAIELGLNGLAFTEHYYYGASEFVEGLRQKYGDRILLFRGVEFSCAEGHCLVFGMDTDGLAMKYSPVQELAWVVNDAGGALIPSHPYRIGPSMGDLVKRVTGLSAIEGYNGNNMHAYNLKAVEAAVARALPFTGGSDAHAPNEVGLCHTEFQDIVTYDNFIELLKAGRYQGQDNRRISRGPL